MSFYALLEMRWSKMFMGRERSWMDAWRRMAAASIEGSSRYSWAQCTCPLRLVQYTPMCRIILPKGSFSTILKKYCPFFEHPRATWNSPAPQHTDPLPASTTLPLGPPSAFYKVCSCDLSGTTSHADFDLPFYSNFTAASLDVTGHPFPSFYHTVWCRAQARSQMSTVNIALSDMLAINATSFLFDAFECLPAWGSLLRAFVLRHSLPRRIHSDTSNTIWIGICELSRGRPHNHCP